MEDTSSEVEQSTTSHQTATTLYLSDNKQSAWDDGDSSESQENAPRKAKKSGWDESSSEESSESAEAEKEVVKKAVKSGWSESSSSAEEEGEPAVQCDSQALNMLVERRALKISSQLAFYNIVKQQPLNEDEKRIIECSQLSISIKLELLHCADCAQLENIVFYSI